MAIALPKQIKIGAHTYNVSFPHVFCDNHMGVGNKDFCEIKVAAGFDGKEYPGTVVLSTFIHEILHQIDLLFALGLFAHDGSVEDESKINALAESVTQMVLDNGWLPKEWREKDEADERLGMAKPIT